jgi:class 3 adenylate cyclase
MVVPKSRREIENRLRQLRPYYGNQLTSKPLKKRARDVKKVRKHLRKLYLLRFLSGFLHYHRDFNNYHMIREVAGCINLLHDERLISLSRTNHTLYEFLLDHERGNEENPISNHVILKADIRGSTDITHTMIERGLNPATHFSLNLFDPITEILSDYNAEKVFVEGDAMILALFDREDSPKDRYAVARACGLAVTILSIVRRYNTKNRKNNLPIIELGIGICYTEGRPAFLFDGEHRIMISPAINQADRLSSCSKRARRKITGKGPFNLYVLQTASEAEMKKTKDDLSFRYNVNGIELNSGGFKKLSKEIDLRNVGIQFPGVQNSHVRLYTGKFPDLNGRYQRLLIREARIPRVRPLDLGSFEMTKNTFYEVCTNAKLYAYVNKVVENK